MILAVTLAGCGGGGGGSSPAPAPAPAPVPAGTIGAAGGTVTGPSGSQVVVPAGALAQSTVIEIAASGAGAPPVPAYAVAIGQAYAFTPHGTSFAKPATVTVPFDPAQLPAEEVPMLLKTNAARDGWERVPNTTVNGNTLVGQVNSFSYFLPVVNNQQTRFADDPPHRIWGFYSHTAADEEIHERGGDFYRGVLDRNFLFGPTSIAPIGNDTEARGSIYSNETGFTYWVEAESPTGNLAIPSDKVGGESRLYQRKFFRKRDANATLNFKVTQAWIEAIDNNGSKPVLASCPWANAQNPALCYDELLGELNLLILTVDYGEGSQGGELHSAHQGIARVWGWQKDWRFSVSTDAVIRGRFKQFLHDEEQFVDVAPIFEERHFDWQINDGAASDSDASLRLSEAVPVSVDLSGLDVGDLFMIETHASALAHNRRGRESYVAARLRDPANSTGLEWEYSGLTPVEDPTTNLDIADNSERGCDSPATPESGTVQFSAPDYSLPEFKHSSARVMVTRTGGSKGVVVARVTSSDGTALEGQHYQSVVQTVVFRDGDTVPREIAVPVIADNAVTGTRELGLEIEAVKECANIGSPSKVPVYILDKDAPPADSFTIGGQITGLVGSGLILQEAVSGREDSVSGGSFTFAHQFPNGAAYDVRVRTQPGNPIQNCTVTNGTGVVSAGDVIDIAVNCAAPTSSGGLDSAFGSGGKVTTGLSSTADRMTLQGDGKIIVLGEHRLGRFNSNGTPDTTFATTGEVTVNFTGIAQVARAVAVQDDGRILVAGQGRPGANDDFALARFNADGTLDSGFGTGGIVYVDFGASERAINVMVQSTGRIVLTGYTTAGGGAADFAAARLTSAGVLDTTFGTGGRVTVSVDLLDIATSAGLTFLDEIVIAGTTTASGGYRESAVVRLLADGALDNAFGGDGSVMVAYTPVDEHVNDIAIQSDRKIVIGGSLNEDTDGNMLVARLNADGSRDTGFGIDGFVSLDYAGEDNESVNAVALQNDGAIVVAGHVASATVTDLALARLTASGALDTSFDGDGKLSIDFFAGSDGARDVRVQSDGRIVAVGATFNASTWVLGMVRVIP
jgi:uncharacterized delta-60 repeat protein